MKCIKCNTDNNLKDRRNGKGRCKNCQHEFAFDPKVMSGVDFTDKFFQQTLQNLSVNNTLFFTKRQLHYFFNQRLNSKKKDPLMTAAGCAIPASFVLGVVLTIASRSFSLLWFVPVLVVVPIAIAVLMSPDLRRRLRGVRPRRIDSSMDQVEGWYRRWIAINGDSGKLLPPVSLKQPQNVEARNINPELKNYSFDRAVVCERPEIAQCLIANNFHFENNAAVLSVDGYPQDIFETVMDMLRRNPALSVYALHDASRRGVELPLTLGKEARWFAGTDVKIYDLGLLPRQLFQRSLFVEHDTRSAAISEPVAASLKSEELQWLNAGNSVALESFPPQILLRVIAQGIGKSRDPQAGDALVPVTTSDIDGGGVYFFAWDSFG